MRKTFTLLLLLITGLAWGQSALFERSFVEHSVMDHIYFNGISEPVIVHNFKDKWLVIGKEGDCYTNSIHQFSSSGDLQLDTLMFNRDLCRSIATYTAVDESSTGLFLSGKTQVADDYPSVWARGFIDRIDTSGVTRKLLMDTSYNAGFVDIDAVDEDIYVIAGKGPDIPYYISSTSIVKYDTSGSKLANIEVENDALAVRALGDDVLVFYEDSILVFDKALQGLLSTLYTVNGFADALYEEDQKLIVLTTDTVLVFDTANVVTDVVPLPQGFEAEHINSAPNGYWAVYGLANGVGQVLVIDQARTIVSTFGIDVACATVTNIAINDSVISLVGQQLINGSNRGFIKTYSYNGTSDSETDDLLLTDIELVVDSFKVLNTHQFGSQVIYDFDIGYHIDFTITNNSADTINYFELMSSKIGGFNCSEGYKRLKFDSLVILPGSIQHYSVSDFRYYISSRDSVAIAYEFTLRSINKGVFNDQCPVAELILNVHDKPLPQINFNIYPNPSTGIYHIDAVPAGSTITVQDLQGRVVLTEQVHDKKTIDLSEQAHGMYLYTVTDKAGKRLATGKLLKH